jgi:O-antigen/teichoic acid export membrane protein
LNSSAESLPQANRGIRPDTLAVSVTILLVANIIQRSIGFGRSLLLCRWLSREELGTWDMAYSFLLLAAPVIVLGLPGSFGRFLERFRQRGQLRTFLRWATIGSATLMAIGCGVIALAAPTFSRAIFDNSNDSKLVILLAASLAAVILHHFLEALFSAFRKFSIVSTMHFCQSISFAAISLVLAWSWRPAAESIIIGYGAACLVSVIGILVWKGRALLAEVPPDTGIPSHELGPVIRFAFWVWLINLFCHLFGIVDRYMLLHYSGLDNDAALGLLGDYHASRVIPILFLSVADLLGGAVMPYLSHDWERGLRQQVSDLVNAILKITSLVMLAGGVVVLWIAPFIFHMAFAGKLDNGLAVMPWTMTYCVWYSLLLVAQNYAWCAEKARHAILPLIAGLMINVLIDLALIPTWGLRGAVVGTTVSTGLAIAVLYWINWLAGMQLHRGMVLFTIAPAALCGGPWAGLIVLGLLGACLPFSRTLVSNSERESLARLIANGKRRLEGYWSGSAKQRKVGHAV